MVLIRDDFPVPDFQMAFMSRSCSDDGEESYATNDKDPEPKECWVGSYGWHKLRHLGDSESSPSLVSLVGLIGEAGGEFMLDCEKMTSQFR